MRAPLISNLGRAVPRIAAGAGLFALAAHAARDQRVRDTEEQVFRAANGLPDGLHRPAWLVMQSGSLAGVGVLAGLTAWSGRRSTAAVMAVAGTAVWAGAKAVKQGFGRGRPGAHLDEVTVRGRSQSGLGFPSGHAAVAVTLASVAAPSLPPLVGAAAWAAAGVTVVSRVYVGAHLPADVIGGAGLGMAVGALARALVHDRNLRR